MRIAVDAMGGDNGPQVILQGAVAAARENPRLRVILVGPQARIREELRSAGADESLVDVEDAPELIDMCEAPAQAVKRKPGSSIVVCARLQREGKADALVSAGNTGAVVAASLFQLGRLAGVSRPAIAVQMPNHTGHTVVLDVGANAESKAVNLLQFAVMGECYAQMLGGQERPRVGLLNIGEESSKGNETVQEAHRLIAESPLNFIGNVEGRGIFAGEADVVVCDGFIGNIVLKLSESVAGFVGSVVRQEINAGLRTRLGAMLIRPAFGRVRQRLDYAEYGGAPLLGVDGVSIIAHGRSNMKAIKNAIMVAARLVESQTNRQIQSQLEAFGYDGQRAATQR